MKYLTWLRPFFFYLNRAKRDGRLEIVSDIHELDFRGIVVWVTDIENTLAARGASQVSDEVYRTFQRAHREGVRFVVLLTNKKFKFEQSGDFWPMVNQLQKVGFEAVFLQQPGKGWWPPQSFNKWPRKPWKSCFRQAAKLATSNLHSWEYASSSILATGDKLRFDVLRPLRLGWYAALVNPLGSDGKGDKFMQIRNVENLTLRLWGMERAEDLFPFEDVRPHG